MPIQQATYSTVPWNGDTVQTASTVNEPPLQMPAPPTPAQPMQPQTVPMQTAPMQPGYNQPAPMQPGFNQPMPVQPGYNQPTPMQPMMMQPGVSGPMMMQPGVSGPMINGQVETGPVPRPYNGGPAVVGPWGNTSPQQLGTMDMSGSPMPACCGCCGPRNSGPAVFPGTYGGCGSCCGNSSGYSPGMVMGDNCNCDPCGCGCSWLNSCCSPCFDECCDCCCDGCCAPRSCFWIRGEYLLWTVKGAPTPALVTSNSNGAAPVIGVPGTQVVYGGSTQGFDMRSGGRFTIGFALPCTCNNFGFESTAFFLGNRTTNNTFASNGIPSLGRPFTNVGPSLNGFPGNQDAELVALPGLVAGSVNVKTSNDIYGVEGNFRFPISCGCNWKVDFLTGFRYLNIDENLQITENLTLQDRTERGVGNIIVQDNFHTRNSFYGGQLGVDAEYRWRRWFVSGTGKLALGDMHQLVNIDGFTAFRDGPNPGVERGGLLALPSNIGSYNRDTFCVVPELGLRLGFNFTERFRGYVGYDVLYVSTVVRPGDQIDTNINPTFLPRNGPAVGAPMPAFQYHSTDFWAQGVSFGLEWRY